jgi:thioredoxin reductase (NADPH)
MSQPILFLVDDRPEVLEALAADLGRRFGTDHRILAEASPGAALDALEELAHQDQEVALVVAGQRMAELPGVPFLLRAHELHPAAKRVLLVGRREWTPTNPAVRAMTLGQVDRHLPVRADGPSLMPVVETSCWVPASRPPAHQAGSYGRLHGHLASPSRSGRRALRAWRGCGQRSNPGRAVVRSPRR